MNGFCKILVPLSIIALTVGGCTKKKAPASNTPSYIDNCTYSSSFKVYKTYTINNNASLLSNCKPDVFLQKQCSHQSSPPFSHNPPTGVNLTGVSLNNNSLTIAFQSFWTLIYFDTLNRHINPPYNWNIVGGIDYPSFNVAINDSFPVFYNYNILPDTIKKTQPNVIYLNGKNATNISIRIENGFGGPDPVSKFNNSYICAEPSITTSSVSFSGPTNYPNSSTNFLVIEYSKISSQLIDNKTIYFITSSIYKKQIVLLN